MKDAISSNLRLLMEDAISRNQRSSSCNQTVISGHQRHSHLWDRTDRNQRSSSRNQWSSVVISATLTCGIARIARRHWRRGTLAASHPSSLINPSPRGSRREIAARSVDLPDEACNQWLMRHRGSRREIAARSVDLPAIRSHQRPSSRNQRSSSRNHYLPSEAMSGHQRQ
jgi:hypothetical protein